MTPKTILLSALFVCAASLRVWGIPLIAPLDLSGALAEQSPDSYLDYPASNALDGNLSNFTHTGDGSPDPFLSITLPEPAGVTSLTIYNRTSCCQDRLQNITVLFCAEEGDEEPVYISDVLNPGGELGSPARLDLELPEPLTIQKVLIRREPGVGSGPGILSIAEVRLFNKLDDAELPLGTDLSHAGIQTLTASQSTTLNSYSAAGALDGNFSNFTHSQGSEVEPWWEADFGEEMQLQRVTIFNRTDCCQGRLRDLVLTVYNAEHEEVWISDPLNPGGELGSPAQIDVDLESLNNGSPVDGQYVRITRMGLGGSTDDNNALSLAEVTITGGTMAGVPVTDLPVLTIQREGNSVKVSWPASTTGFELESSVNLKSPWAAVPGVVGNSVTLPLTEAIKSDFFRLRKSS